MYIGPRDEKACALEVETIEEYCQRVFGVDLDLVALKSQLHNLIIEKIEDYIYQRFRDWSVTDLIRLEAEVEALAVKRANVAMKKPSSVDKSGSKRAVNETLPNS